MDQSTSQVGVGRLDNVKAVKPSGAMDEVAKRLSESVQHAIQVDTMLGATSVKMFGAVPEPVRDDGEAPMPEGSVGQMHRLLDALEEALNAAERHAARLNGL